MMKRGDRGQDADDEDMDDLTPVEILLVEDNSADAEMTLRALRKRNLSNHVAWVKDGPEALDYLFCLGPYGKREVGNPKLVLLDLKMPKMDGIEVLRKIREDERTRLVPVVMLTSSAEENDIVRSYKLGVNSYIVKPVEFDKFVEEVSKLGVYWTIMNRAPSSP
jgi:two-component system response regulator